MPILADYHMHTPRCQHALGPMRAYVERAVELGLSEVGFSDHNPLPRSLGANVRMKESELAEYVQDVLDLRREFAGTIKVRLGLELDYIEGLEDYLLCQTREYPWDYVIGSIHYLDTECRVGSWSRQPLADVDDHYDRYFRRLRELAGSGLCDIIAHMDVAKRTGKVPGPNQTDAIRETLHTIKHAGLAVEINTSGYRHPELPEPQPYPSLDIAAQAVELDIPLTVNSDAHAPEQVGLQFGLVEAWLDRVGCRSLARFEGRKRATYPLAQKLV
jgi:histidinol-phosphatase (PHP family)